MNIGIVCYPTYGGSGVVASELGISLANLGHKVHIISYSLPFRLNGYYENLFFHEVSANAYPLFEYVPYEPALSSKIVDVALHESLDILHVHYAIPHASAAFLAREILKSKGKYLPFVTTLHGTDITLVGKDPSYSPVVSFSINNSDAVTSVSADLKNETQAIFEIKNKIHVIPNFIDFSKIDYSIPTKKTFCESQEKLIIHISNFRPVKRAEDVVRIFHKLLQKSVNAKLIMVGDGPEKVNTENLCRELKICDKIRFIGKLDSVENILKTADLFILPSQTESFGLAALEAMACGVPVLCSNAGGLPEVVENGKSGYLCEVGDLDDFAQKAIEILDAKNLSEFKIQAQERAKAFDLRKILPLYVNLYQETIDKSLGLNG